MHAQRFHFVIPKIILFPFLHANKQILGKK